MADNPAFQNGSAQHPSGSGSSNSHPSGSQAASTRSQGESLTASAGHKRQRPVESGKPTPQAAGQRKFLAASANTVRLRSGKGDPDKSMQAAGQKRPRSSKPQLGSEHGSSSPRAPGNASKPDINQADPVHPEHQTGNAASAAMICSIDATGTPGSVQASADQLKTALVNLEGMNGWPEVPGIGLDQYVSQAIRHIAIDLDLVDVKKSKKGLHNLTMKALVPKVEGKELKEGWQEVQVGRHKYMAVDLEGTGTLRTALKAAGRRREGEGELEGEQSDSTLPMLQICGHGLLASSGISTAASVKAKEVLAGIAASYDAAEYDQHLLETANFVSRSRELSTDLTEQRERLVKPRLLAEALKKPLPVALQSSAVVNSRAAKLVAESNFMEYIGPIEPFFSQLSDVAPGLQDQPSVAIVAQASGSGKSRLAYSMGERYFVGLIQLTEPNSDALYPAWARIVDIAQAAPQLALNAMVLLLASYLEFAADVTVALAERNPGMQEKDRREIALRALRNGLGQMGANLLFARACSDTQLDPDSIKLERWNKLAEPVIGYLMAVCAKLASAAPMDHIWLFIDEAQILTLEEHRFAVPRAGQSTASEAQATVSKIRDGLYVLGHAVRKLAYHCRCRSVICGSWLDLVSVRALPKSSPYSGKVQVINHSSFITAADMQDVLKEYFDLTALSEQQTHELDRLLHKMQGRPSTFFRYFLPELIQSSATCSDLGGLIITQAELSLKRVKSIADQLLTGLWDMPPHHTEDDIGGYSARSLLVMLYFAVSMGNSSFMVQSSEVQRLAMLHGILLHRTSDMEEDLSSGAVVRLDEPWLRDAVSKLFKNMMSKPQKFARLFPDESATDAFDETSFRYQLLRDMGTRLHDNPGSPGGKLTSAVKGDLFELLIALGFVVHCVDKPEVSLPELIEFMGICPPDFDASVLASGPANIKRAVDASTLADGSNWYTQLLDGTLESGTLLFNIPDAAGADLAFCTEALDGHGRRLVLIQAKAKLAANLPDAVRAATPAWQFAEKVRSTLSWLFRGEPVARAIKEARSAFLDTAQAYPYEMDHAARIVFTCSLWQDKTVNLINELNKKGLYADSPVCLCNSSAKAFGRPLHNSLQRLSSPPAHPEGSLYLLHLASIPFYRYYSANKETVSGLPPSLKLDCKTGDVTDAASGRSLDKAALTDWLAKAGASSTVR